MLGKPIASYMKFFLILPIFAIILVSGCTGGSISGPGIVILNFEPDTATVSSGDPVQLRLRVQNQGTTRALDVRARIAGINLDEWGTFGTLLGEQSLGDMIGRDIETNTQGEIQTAEWNLRAADIPNNMEWTFTPIVKVSYDYTTTAQKPIWVVNNDELRNIRDRGGTLPSSATTTSQGPLSVYIEMKPYVRTGGEGFESVYDVFPVQIRITNTQGGTVVPGSFGGFGGLDGENYPIEVKITPPTGTEFVHSGYGLFDDCTSGVVIENLFKNRDADITCELRVTNPPLDRDQRLLTVEIKYRYEIESQTQMRVIGRERSFLI